MWLYDELQKLYEEDKDKVSEEWWILESR
jgi:hypothetical protein